MEIAITTQEVYWAIGTLTTALVLILSWVFRTTRERILGDLDTIATRQENNVKDLNNKIDERVKDLEKRVDEHYAYKSEIKLLSNSLSHLEANVKSLEEELRGSRTILEAILVEVKTTNSRGR